MKTRTSISFLFEYLDDSLYTFNHVFGTLKGAQDRLSEMANGYPKDSSLRDDSRKYWKDQASKIKIVKRTRTTKLETV